MQWYEGKNLIFNEITALSFQDILQKNSSHTICFCHIFVQLLSL